MQIIKQFTSLNLLQQTIQCVKSSHPLEITPLVKIWYLNNEFQINDLPNKLGLINLLFLDKQNYDMFIIISMYML